MFLKYKKIILSAVLASFILSGFYFISTPKAYATDLGAGWANFWQFNFKEFVVDTIARSFARRLLKKYLDSVVDQVNKSGRTGRQPSFALNWRNFLTDGQYRGEDVFRAVLSNTTLCPYFKNPIRTVFNVTTNKPITQNTRVNNLDPFTKRGRCTLPKGWTIEDYTADFARNGGWQALNQLAEPQNNFYGSFLMSLGEVSAQRALDAHADQREIQAGGGFTGTRASCKGSGAKGSGASGFCLPSGSKKICNNAYKACNTDRDCPNQDSPGGPPYGSCLLTQNVKLCSNNQGQACLRNEDCVVSNDEARCTFLGETLTPGKLLGDSASQYIDKNIGWLISSDELSEVLLNMLGGIINKMTNFRQMNNLGTDVDDTEGQRTNSKAARCQKQCSGKKGNDYKACIDSCMGLENSTDLPSPCDPTDPACSIPPPPPPPLNCGNGVIDSSEQCDGGNLNGKVCSSIGYTSGNLSCNSSCQYDTSACTGLTLPDSTAAITACSDGGTTPTNSNVCLTAQWFRQGQAGAVDPTGLCATSHCVILNHNIWDGSTDANIYQNGFDIVRLLGASDYFNGTRVRRCISEGDIVYGLATNRTSGFSLTLNVPPGGSGTCP